MWRRVASQSPTSPTPNGSSDDDSGSYLTAWRALGKMLALGKSLSGRERNCCFLNLGGITFADVSAVSGFDFPADGRGLALTDWDHDGKLDAWLTNRTAPRLQFLKNDNPNQNHTVSISLKGKQCNRDAIGARVILVDVNDRSQRVAKTLRAGEGYLSQSSKWLHFGLGAKTERVHAKVGWPDGTSQVFRDLAADSRYRIEQGDRPRLVRKRVENLAIAPGAIELPQAAAEKRVVLPARIPMPKIEYEQFSGEPAELSFGHKPLLINVWATWCQPCLAELSEWQTHADEISQHADVVLLSADLLTTKDADKQTVQAKLSELGVSFPSGLASQETMETLDIVQRLLSKRIRALNAPTSFLIDTDGGLAILYRGGVDWPTLEQDLRSLSRNGELRNTAVPFAGRWYTNPFPPDLLAIPQAYRERGKPAKSLEYLVDQVATLNAEASEELASSRETIAQSLVDLGIEFQRDGKLHEVTAALEAAVQLTPDSFKTRMALAMVHQQTKNYEGVVTQYRQLIRLKPNDVILANNLAWTLATCPNEKVRLPREALGLAKQVCDRTKQKLPSALDTLAAANAACGDFEEAKSVARRALLMVKEKGDVAAEKRLEARVALYEQSLPFIDE